MSIVSEFKSFVMRGNVVDLAIGVIIGGAFNNIVKSLIEDVITPLALNPLLERAHVNTLSEFTWHSAKLGMFLSSVISFLLTAFVLFMLVKVMNKIRLKEEAEKTAAPEAPPAPSKEELLLTEIRDLLKK
jgi:large conductance mechanosensitive channel